MLFAIPVSAATVRTLQWVPAFGFDARTVRRSWATRSSSCARPAAAWRVGEAREPVPVEAPAPVADGLDGHAEPGGDHRVRLAGGRGEDHAGPQRQAWDVLRRFVSRSRTARSSLVRTSSAFGRATKAWNGA